MRKCSKCGQKKPKSEFYKCKSIKDGVSWQCKPCNNERVKVWKAANPERTKAISKRYQVANREERRAYRAANKERRNRTVRAWRERNHARFRIAAIAYGKVNYALKIGTLAKLPCEVCGAEKVEGHHEDYSKPLDVNWLCMQCHHDRHSEINDRRTNDQI